MKYPEYLISARRHNHACRILKNKLDELAGDGEDSEEFKFLVSSMYYLSGYIIECAIKFKIFELKGYDPTLDVDIENCNAAGIDYKRHIRIHNFSSLQNYLDSLISGLSHISDKRDVNRLLSEWSPEIRYANTDLDYAQIKAFYDHSTQYLRKV